MNDFDYDCLQKKRIAKCAKNHVNARRGRCKLPHEYLSAKERNALNGEVKTYNLKAPMSNEEFKGLRRDLKASYLKYLQEEFRATDPMIADLFGVTPGRIGQIRKKLGVESLGKGARTARAQLDSWNAWRNGGHTATEAPYQVTGYDEPETETTAAAETKPDGKAAAVEKKSPVADIQGFRVIWENVHSWEELYALAKQFPFPGRPAKIRLDLV